jgi:3-oxoacyl-[acyl-carrier protein] reductase
MLPGKVAIVTGAGRGIGSEIARLFASEGALVVVHYNKSRKAAEALAASLPGSAIALQADLTDGDAARGLIESAVNRFGKIDILVNNAAGFVHDIPFEDDTWESYIKEFNGVLGATFHPTKAAVPHLKANGGGRIVNFVATLVNRPAVGFGAHTTAKGAVLAFTRTLSKELGPYNITVNAVSPGMTMTEYSTSMPEATKKSVTAQTPLRRLAEPIDVARVVLFYASDLAGNVTGANIAPDGGLAIIG